MIEFIFMLTHDDKTVDDAVAVYEQTRGSGLRYVGFKDIGASPAVLAEVTSAAHADGLEVMLEVVSTSATDELQSLRAALGIGVDWVLGGTHADAGSRYSPAPSATAHFPGGSAGTRASSAVRST